MSVLRAVSSRLRNHSHGLPVPATAGPAAAEADVIEVEVAPGAGAIVVEAERPYSPSPAGWVARGLVWAAIAFVVFAIPLLRDPVEANIYSQAVIYAIIGLSLNVLLGYTGQISLGHQAFVGIGAFTSAYMVTVHGQPFFAAVAVAMAVGALQALVLGVVSLRVTGLYFALVTLSYGLMAQDTLFNIQALTGGSAGQPAPKPTLFESDYRYYYLCLAFLGAVIWVDWRLMKTKGGRALLALRENPKVAATFGTDVKMYTLMAFVVAGVFAGLGGALLAHNVTSVVLDQFSFQLALIFVLMTVVGGLRSRAGVIIGSAFFSIIDYLVFGKINLDAAINAIQPFEDLPGELAPIVVGPLLLLFTLTTHPGGIGQQIRPVQRWLKGGRFSLHGTGEAEVRVSDVRA
ncbi:MAG: branched-chain amino acid ABC transporter permease [Actinomycetota bacterium]|nr:branched-chain amino acid ABC transporter permease [Actinomycetota bacterium]